MRIRAISTGIPRERTRTGPDAVFELDISTQSRWEVVKAGEQFEIRLGSGQTAAYICNKRVTAVCSVHGANEAAELGSETGRCSRLFLSSNYSTNSHRVDRTRTIPIEVIYVPVSCRVSSFSCAVQRRCDRTMDERPLKVRELSCLARDSVLMLRRAVAWYMVIDCPED